MRLFGLLGGELNQKRASYSFALPFDVSFASVILVEEIVDHGGFILDQESIFTDQYLISYPDWVFPLPPRIANPLINHPIIQGSLGGMVIYARPGVSRGALPQGVDYGDVNVEIEFPDPVAQGAVIATIQGGASSTSNPKIWGSTN
jgi:hypothetical protein